jgi:hypothetical protein
MNHPFVTRQLTAEDAADVQACFDSQPKVMMEIKRGDRQPYADTFLHLVRSGCVAFGAWREAELQAFSIVWRWQSMPTATIVMSCNRPTGGLYNPIKSGLQASLDACLLHMEGAGCRVFYYVRSSGKAWRSSTAKRNHGRFGQYSFTAAEKIGKGQTSQYPAFNQMILGGRPVSADAVIVAAIAPMDQDF